jgi:hypothetical protein
MADKKSRFDHVKKHHEQIWKEMQAILAVEGWQRPHSDDRLVKAIMERGCFCTPTMVRDVRLEHGIGNSDERRVTNYARDFKSKKVK